MPQTPAPKAEANAGSGRTLAIALCVLAAIVLAMFADVIFVDRPELLSRGADMHHYFLHARRFGFSELSRGNLALWNPYVYGGTPFFGNFQSALLYPPNAVHLLLDVRHAINLSVALHVFAIGAFMFLWMRFRGLHWAACGLAAVLMMFCGAYFLHIMAGHLSNLCTMAWAPLLFLAIDGWFERRTAPWLGLGAGVVSMQILAGHPQYVFFTAVAAGLYVLCHVFAGPRRLSKLLGPAAMYAAAAALTAVQLWTGLEAAGESVRSGPLPYEFVAETSFAPENVLTAVAPRFFGDAVTGPYWGRSYVWEMSVFCGAAALALAAWAALRADRRKRRFAALLSGILFVLALGSHTPLFWVLVHYVPPFGSFRGHGKFIFCVSIFVILLAAVGLDGMIRRRERRHKAAIAIGAVAALAGVGALWVHVSGGSGVGGWWRALMAGVFSTGEGFVSAGALDDGRFVGQAADVAATSLAWGAAALAAAAGLVALSGRRAAAAYGIALLAAVEVVVFARTCRPTYEPDRIRSHPAIERWYRGELGEARFFDNRHGDRAVSAGVWNAWGSGPGVRRRYAQVMALTQGQDPSAATQIARFSRTDRKALLSMLRVAHAVVSDSRGVSLQAVGAPMRRLNLISSWRVLRDSNEMFQALAAEDFDPRREVLLEAEPGIEPSGEAPAGAVRLLESSTDHLLVEAQTSVPAILLITDAYSRDWRASADDGRPAAYTLMPANHCLQGIPLTAGRHRIRIEYAPKGYRTGKWVSIVSVFAYAAGWASWFWLYGRRRKAVAGRA